MDNPIYAGIRGWNGFSDCEPELPSPSCPACGSEAERFYTDGDGDVIGCEECISVLQYWEVPTGA